MTVESLTEGLNPEQARAVRTLDGPLLILAGAGSGKTRVLTRRIAALLARGTVGEGAMADWLRPWNILAVTFTNKAAEEMRHRVADLVGDAAAQVWVSTFHSTCVRILRQDIEPLGWRRDFVVYDDDDQLRVIKAVLDELKISHKDLAPSAVRGRIDRHKNGISAGEFIPRGDPFPKILELYGARMKAANALDFNDLINKVVELYETQPAVLEKWQRRWRYILVDEYQDTNPAQYRLLKLLSEKERNLAVVGDDDQSIYRFRGADIRNILEFEEDFPGAAVIRLEQNYRSKGHILKAASGVVRNNRGRKDKTLWTAAEDGEPLQLLVCDDETAEADEVVSRMLRMRRPWGDYAVIYRTNAQSRPIEQALTRNRVPYVLVGGRKFYDRAEVKDLLGYLRLIVNPDDDVAFARIVNTPTRGLGDKALANLREEAARQGKNLRAAARTMGGAGGRAGNALAAFTLMMDRFESLARVASLPDLILTVARESGYVAMLEAEGTDEAKGRLENVNELATSGADAFDADTRLALGLDDDEEITGVLALRAFLDRATLSGQADELPSDGGRVTLLTAHLAKGLEFPVVFVVGMAEKCFPHSRAELEEDIEEERRLAYVAITRARERLFLSLPRRRRSLDGWFADTEPSRFLMEIPEAAMPRPDTLRPQPAWRGNSSAGLAFGRGAPAAPPGRGFGGAPAAPPAFRGGATNRLPSSLGGSPARPSAAPAPLRAAPRPADLRTMRPESMDGFQTGTEILHPLLGTGTIQKRDGTPANPRLTIHFDQHGPRTVYAVTASLEIVIRT